MKFELKNQQLTADIDVKKTWPMLWHKDEEGKKTDDLSMDPCQIHLEFSGDITLDTGSLKMTDCMSLMRIIDKLDKIHADKIHKMICQEVQKAA